jgi:glycosyltransferase involved in cell wall biosynthesis
VLNVAKALSNERHSVTVLWFVSLKSLGDLPFFFRMKNHVDCAWILSPSLPFFYSRLLGRLGRLYAQTLIWILCKVKHVHTIQAEGIQCVALSKWAKIRCVVDIHGDLIAEQLMKGTVPWPIKQAQYDEAYAVRKADAFIVVSNAMAITLQSRHGRIPRTVLAPCGVSAERFSKGIKSRLTVRRELQIEDRIVACYMGGLQPWQCVPETIQLVSRLKQYEPRIFFLLLTQSDSSSLGLERAGLGLEGRDYLCLSLDYGKVGDILPAADIGLLLRENDPVNTVSSPTKCGEYLAAGLPVVATRYAGDAPEIVTQSDGGMILSEVCPNGIELAELCRFVGRVISEREIWLDRCTEAAIRYHNWNASSKALSDLHRERPAKPQIETYTADALNK